MHVVIIRRVAVIALLTMAFVQPGQGRQAQSSKSQAAGSMQSTVLGYGIAGHRSGKLLLSITNNGTFGSKYVAVMEDCFTGELVPSCEYPAGSGVDYLYSGAYWIGGIVGEDTLVSEGHSGWDRTPNEFAPDEAVSCGLIKRSTANEWDPLFVGARSYEDFIAVYTDTFPNSIVPHDPDFFNSRPHQPLNVAVTENTYSWPDPHTEDFVLFEYLIKNIGQQTITEAYMGIFVDGDVCADCPSSGGADDLTGFMLEAPSILFPAVCGFTDTVNLAWIADNDGDLQQADLEQARHVTGISVLKTPIFESQGMEISYNWWLSDNDAALDWGPRHKADTLDLGTGGGEGTPMGDVNKYHFLKNGEVDYDQAYTATILDTDPLWKLPDSANAAAWATGADTRYLLSFGPFDLDPGETVPFVFAYVAGEDLHVHPDTTNFDSLPGNPDAYYAALDFSSIGRNAIWANLVYDYPGVDTDGDGDSGQVRISCDTSGGYDTVFYRGDGVPDWLPAYPLPAPVITDTMSMGNDLRLRWNGFASETAVDPLSRKLDFDGYKVYLANDPAGPVFNRKKSYDVENYSIHTLIGGDEDNVVVDAYPATSDSIKCRYANESCSDTAFDVAYCHFYEPCWVPPDSVDKVYFERYGDNSSDLTDSTSIYKVYPSQPYPSSLDLLEAHPNEVIDGRFKYFEYETILTDLPDDPFLVSVVAEDFGMPHLGLGPIQSSRAQAFIEIPGFSVGLSEQQPNGLPRDFVLAQNYPNPFNPSTTISFDLPKRAKVNLSVFNLLGQKITTLVNEEVSAGHHQVVWDGTDSGDNPVASGIYFYRLDTGTQSIVKKMVLLK